MMDNIRRLKVGLGEEQVSRQVPAHGIRVAARLGKHVWTGHVWKGVGWEEEGVYGL